MPVLSRIDEHEHDLSDRIGELAPFAEPLPPPSSTASTVSTSVSAATGLTSPPPELPTLNGSFSKSTRSIIRELTWEELWAAWSTLEPTQIEAAKESKHPLDVIPWPTNRDLYGNVLNFDLPPAIHPPRRTSYALRSPWTLGKLQLDRGMHLEIIRSIHELRYGADHIKKWQVIWNMLQSWNPPWHLRRKRVMDSVGRAQDFSKCGEYHSALGELANAWLYTLPYFPEAGPHAEVHIANVASSLAVTVLLMIARTATLACRYVHAGQYEVIARVGWTAAKAVLWRADTHTVRQVQVACPAADLLNECMPKNQPRKVLALEWVEQSRMLNPFPGRMRFHDVPDSCRVSFFQFNSRNEHAYHW